jgi:cysteine-rich repeat protein
LDSYEKLLGLDGCFKIECGNGIKNSNEGCDDNNTISADGCSAIC